MLYEIFFSGVLLMCHLVAGLFFRKFWKKTHDQLFLFFSWAFFLLSIERLVIGIGTGEEPGPHIYVIRLMAFSLIIFAVVRKNKATA